MEGNIRSVSIALATYNGQAFLPQQVESLLAQTSLPSEIVVRDDGSTDGTVDWLKKLSQNSRQGVSIRVLASDENLGTAPNFERIIRATSGDVVFLCDQDDVWDLNKIERVVAGLKRFPEAMFAFSNAEIVDQQLSPLDYDLWSGVGFQTDSDVQSVHLLDELARHNVVTGATMAFRREAFEQVPKTPANWLHDEWLAWNFSLRGPAVAFRQPLIRYRQHSSQQVGIGAPTVKTQLSQWNKKRGEAFDESLRIQIEKIRDARSSLEQAAEGSSEQMQRRRSAAAILDEREHHLLTRNTVRQSTFRSMPRWIQECLSGRYRKFGNGPASAFRDLLRI